MKKNKKIWLRSLKTRFLISALLCLLAALSGTLWLTRDTGETQNQSQIHLKSNHRLLEQIRLIRWNLQSSFTYLDAFLFAPGESTNKSQALKTIDTAKKLSVSIKNNPLWLSIATSNLIDKIVDQFDIYHRNAQQLFDIRGDASRQYPALALGNKTMGPTRDLLDNLFNVVINEMQQENSLLQDPEIYTHAVYTRHLWTHLLSNFRIYLANRLGSFDEQALHTQETSIEALYQELYKNSQILSQSGINQRLGFEGSIAVEQLLGLLDQWLTGYRQIRHINSTDDWRMDAKVMKEQVVPAMETLSTLLFTLENLANEASINDFNLLSGSNKRQLMVINTIAGIMITLILALLWSVDRLVLRPINQVANALKAESDGKESFMLPNTQITETDTLINAFREMASRVHKRQNDLEHQALHDALTGLPNRTLLRNRISHDIQVARREHSHVSLLMIDLDHFKEINDTLGHHIGDQVLIEVSTRIAGQLRKVDTVARLGGDEFAVILPGTDGAHAAQVSSKLLQTLTQGLHIDDLQLFVGMSIGIACYPDHGDDSAGLIQHADVAMYQAKNNRTGYAIYDAGKDNYSMQRLELINDLRNAINDNTLDLCFQPIFNIASGKIRGVEALLRWQHTIYGDLPPDQVIDLAEHTGLINPLTYWVLEQALVSIKNLRRFSTDLYISVNISAYNLKDPQFIQRIRQICERQPLAPDMLAFELTESAMMSNPSHATEVLTELDKMGIRISVDDFGTGFSSLAYLKQLPVDELKIDKSFISNMHRNGSDDIIVHSTIKLAHNLGLEVVAEGIENPYVYEMLKDYGCNSAQGHFLSKPLNDEQIQQFLKDQPILKEYNAAIS